MADIYKISVDLTTRRSTALQSIDIREIQAMERAELLSLQEALGYGKTWGYWEAPEAWCAKGGDWRRRVECGEVGSQEGDRIWTETLRLCLLLSLTRSIRNYSVPLTVCQHGRVALRIGALLATRARPATGWWSRATTQEVRALGAREKQVGTILKKFYDRGLLPDAPIPSPHDDASIEVDRHGEHALFNDPDNSKPWQPLPDEFTAQCGQRVLWIVEKLGGELLNCYQACVEVQAPPPRYKRASPNRPLAGRRESSHKALIQELRSGIVRAYEWKFPDGTHITDLPFSLSLRPRTSLAARFGRIDESVPGDFCWPPSCWGELVQLVSFLQKCHLWMMFLSSGPRHATVLSFTVNSLVSSPTGYRFKAEIYKQEGQFCGKTRDWPIAPALATTMFQQIRLSRLVKRLTRPHDPESLGDHLWVQFRGNKKKRGSIIGGPLKHLNDSMERLVDVFDLRDLLGPENPTMHTHRFRKTLARLLALALTSAQMVLMDCFGHDDPEMTLGYMLSDKTIVADALRVQRELVILLAKDAVMDAEKLGGPMGDVIREARHHFLRLKDKSSLAPEDAYELADQLTLGGREWVFVMEGVICTLSQFDAGPCGGKTGIRRNPMNCQSGCLHQLIQAHHMNRTDDMVGYLVEQLRRAENEQAEMLVAALVGQLKNHLYRWKEIYEKWSNNELVQRYCDLREVPWWIRDRKAS